MTVDLLLCCAAAPPPREINFGCAPGGAVMGRLCRITVAVLPVSLLVVLAVLASLAPLTRRAAICVAGRVTVGAW
jgi:hypothetical protein